MADFHLWATYAIIAATVAAYVSERFTLELVALGSLVAFLVLFALFPYQGSAGSLRPDDLLTGFANPALGFLPVAFSVSAAGFFAMFAS